MGMDVFAAGDSERLKRMGTYDPATQVTPQGTFSNFFPAIGQGVVGGVAAVGRLAGDWFAQAGKAELQYSIAQNPYATEQQVQEAADLKPVAPFDESLKAVQQWAKLDPRTTGGTSMVAGNLAHGLTVFGMGSLLGGPTTGAVLTGATEGYNGYLDLQEAGVDAKTAATSGVVTGLAATAGAYLPMKMTGNLARGLLGLGMQAEAGGASTTAAALYSATNVAATLSGNTAANLAYGAAINTGFGMASRALTSKVLEAGGYPEMAKQYEALDGAAIAADAILGLAFGGWAHYAEGKPAAKPTPDAIEKAFDIRREEQINRGAAGIPVDADTAHLDFNLQSRALNEMLQGKNPQVTYNEATAVLNGVLADPQKTQLHADFVEAGQRVYGDMAEFAEPTVNVKMLEPVVQPEATPVPPSAQAAETTVKLDPVAEENMRQIMQHHPEMTVQMPDGSEVSMAEFEQKMRQNLALAESESKLHDVAVACFLRTE